MVGKLYFTIGLPRAGKSTFCASWQREQKSGEENNWMVPNPRVVLEGDAFRKAVSGARYNEYAEQYVKPILRTSARALLNSGYDVLIDDTHTTWGSISEVLKLDPDAIPLWVPANEYGSYFAVPSPQFLKHAEECKERAKKLDQSDLLPIIDRMVQNLCEMWPVFNMRIDRERQKARKFVYKVV